MATQPLQPPGPPNLWLLRNLRALVNNPIPVFESSWKTYGDIVRFHWRGPFSAYLLSHPDYVERVLQSNWSNYSRGFVYARIAIVTRKGVLTSEGDLWLKQRRLMQPAFHRQKLSTLADMMARTTAEMLDEWDGQGTAAPFDCAAAMMELTLIIVGRTLFGSDLRDRTDDLRETLENAMEHVQHRFHPFSLPERVPTPHNRRFLASQKRLDSLVLSLVQERRASGDRPDDLLTLLLEARDESTGEGIDDAQLVDEVLTLLAAGHKTVADTLSWAWYLLALHPHWREALEDEAEAVLSGRVPTLDDLPHLPVSRQIVDETLRLYPAVWMVNRESIEEDEVGGYQIGARCSVACVTHFTHRHPDFWPRPEDYDPSRFAPGAPSDRPKFAYYPFGGGPRLCMGQHYAVMEAQLVLATIASRYRLDLVPGQTVEKQSFITMRPKNGVWMTRRARAGRDAARLASASGTP